jgi:FdhE protein
MPQRWQTRILRAQELATQYPAAAEVLGFYGEIAVFQKQVFDATALEQLPADPMRPFDEQLVRPAVLTLFPFLLELVETKGPAGLARAARDLRQKGEHYWRRVLESQSAETTTAAEQFFARVCLQPVAEYLAFDGKVQLSGYTGALCPVCGAPAQVSVLRPEGQGGKRSLLCSCCSTEWDFRRVLCPNCAEESHTKLPRFSTEHFPHVHLEACDTCKRYLKSVDLTIDGRAIPLVDEIAAAPLDLWAAERGYEKIELNLMGL